MKPVFLLFALLLVVPTPRQLCAQKAEWVYVSEILDSDDEAIVVRKNGDAYLIEKGTGCMSLWRFEGKRVLITYRGLFLGVGSRLVIPDRNQDCRIWDSAKIESWSEAEPISAPGSVDYSIDFGLVLDLENLRPLVEECLDLGPLEEHRSWIEGIGDFEDLREVLEEVGFAEFYGCPVGISESGIQMK